MMNEQLINKLDLVPEFIYLTVIDVNGNFNSQNWVTGQNLTNFLKGFENDDISRLYRFDNIQHNTVVISFRSEK